MPKDPEPFCASVVSWAPQRSTGFVLITMSWEAGGPPRDYMQLQTEDGENHRLYVRGVEVGETFPEILVAVAFLSPGVEKLARGLTVFMA